MTPPPLSARWRQAVTAVPKQTFLMWEGTDESTATWACAAFDRLVDELPRRSVGKIRKFALQQPPSNEHQIDLAKEHP